MKAKQPAKPAERIEELPDAWERFEKAFDTVMKARPKPAPAKPRRASSPAAREKRGGKEPA